MRRPDGPYSFWEMKEIARLRWTEPGRAGRLHVMHNAKVSTENGHRCRQCYCCACVEVWSEGKRDRL